jgi:hypothetical protein
MITPIDRYLDELEGLLKKRVGKEARVKMVDEIHAHLLMSKRDLIASGTSPEEAEKLALEHFGNPTLVAADLIRQHTGVNTKSVWKLAKLPMALFLLTFCFGIVMNFSMTMVPTWFQIYRACMILCLLGFAFAVLKSRRWLLMPMVWLLLGCRLVSIPLAAWRQSGMPGAMTSSIGRQAVLASNEKSLKEMEDELGYAQRAFAAAQSGKPIPIGAVYFVTHVAGEKRYPLEPQFTKIGMAREIWGFTVSTGTAENTTLVPAANNMDAIADWKLNGQKAIETIHENVAQFRELNAERVHPNVALAALRLFFGSTLVLFGTNILVLAIVNALILWLAALSDRLRLRGTPNRVS